MFSTVLVLQDMGWLRWEGLWIGIQGEAKSSVLSASTFLFSFYVFEDLLYAVLKQMNMRDSKEGRVQAQGIVRRREVCWRRPGRPARLGRMALGRGSSKCGVRPWRLVGHVTGAGYIRIKEM